MFIWLKFMTLYKLFKEASDDPDTPTYIDTAWRGRIIGFRSMHDVGHR